jgi:Atypical Arm repeat
LLNASDTDVVSFALHGLDNILYKAKEVGPEEMVVRIHEVDGVKTIEDLQQHERPDIRERATKLINAYFLAPTKTKKASKRRRRY